MVGNIIGITVAYLIIGGMTLLLAGEDIADDDDYVAAGVFFFWPLYIIKGIVWLIGASIVWSYRKIRHDGHRWFVIPYRIGKMLQRTTLNLLGLYRPSHYKDAAENVILVNARTGREVVSGRTVHEVNRNL